MAASTRARRRGEKVLPAVHPNVGLEVEYRRRLQRLIAEMDHSFRYWLAATYKANEPVMAQDEPTPAVRLRVAVNKLARRWQKRFDVAADELAEYFATAIEDRSSRTLRRILKKGGYTVRFKMTKAMRDVMKATIAEQVGLIKSIPQQYLVNVQGAVMRSVTAGRDLESLTKEIKQQYGVAHRRAALIARSQNNMATANMTRVRQTEAGITEAVWLHSLAGKEPRPSHLANNGKRYSVTSGWWDPDEKKWILPGQLINCRCTSKPVVKGFS